MTGFVRIVGWVAFAAGILSLGLPIVFPDAFLVATAITLCAVLIVSGTLLVGLAELLTTAERIQENTGWLEVGRPTADLPPAEIEVRPASAADLARNEELPVETEIDSVPADSDPLPQTASVARPTNGAPDAPELYDASRHPAAVEEWSHRGRRVMTLEDGTLATEVEGAWYRFIRLEDIESLGR